MTVRIRKTYRDINPEMLSDEIQGEAQKHGIEVGEKKVQTYGLPSGATQTLVTLAFKTPTKQPEDGKECGSAQIISVPGGETKLLIDLDENLLPEESISSFQENLDFLLDSYEVKW